MSLSSPQESKLPIPPYNPTPAWSTKEDLEWLIAIEQGNLKAQEVELAACKEDPWRFLTHWCLTEDAQNEDSPFQLFPNDEHLYWITVYWLSEQYLLVPKSRQMTVTWLISALYLWHSLFYPSRLTMFQCKKEEDSKANLERANVIWERLPKWMQEWQPCKKTETTLSFPRSRSEIIAVAAGSKHFRQRTLTGLFVDEGAFDPELDQVFGAAKSALGKVGKFTCISSSSPGPFSDMVFDRSI